MVQGYRNLVNQEFEKVKQSAYKPGSVPDVPKAQPGACHLSEPPVTGTALAVYPPAWGEPPS